MLRRFVFLLLLIAATSAEPLNFTRFIEIIETIRPELGALNRTALTLIFEEDASEIGISPQEHVKTCADCLFAYWNITEELKSVGDGQRSEIKQIFDTMTRNMVKKLEPFIPYTVAFVRSKLREMMEYEAAGNGIVFAETSMYVLVNSVAVKQMFNSSTGLNNDAYKAFRSGIVYGYAALNKEEKSIIDRVFCYKLLKRTIFDIDVLLSDERTESTEDLMQLAIRAGMLAPTEDTHGSVEEYTKSPKI